MNNNYLIIKELYHHGIKGQRWGVRRYQNEDGSLTEEGKAKYGKKSNRVPYSDEQYLRDKDVYGKFAADRINKATLEGRSVSGARSKEADRINNFRVSANVAGNGAGIVGGILGAIGAYHVGKNKIASTGNKEVDAIIGTTLITGGALVGSILAKKGGESTAMLLGGYSPSKSRE